MTQRSIEILIGRLMTNEPFRLAFRRDARTTLTNFVESGHDLTPVEVAALRATPIGVWEQVAREIDPRLQEASLRGPLEEEP
ncbi:MAG: hypothetical protein F9K18_01935 [Thermoanaerobaculia bacterium]|nr:MAG: hypothetical protein F9K18_01935 [Thermoanaerobaculia bacterium]